MIELENNDTKSKHQKLELDMSGEDGVVFFTVNDAETGDTVIDMTTSNLEEMSSFLADAANALRDAWARA